ncbi:MAG: branched-chain amino acid transport system ATP-binding protein livF, partial [Actinomycetota bacterium]|nr:branched-chain amino acid transport system ATP-binding protein livF [Actinomycetota bacterium]
DRLRRVSLAVVGAAVWAVFGFVTGLASVLWFLVVARSGANLGRAVVTPTHNSLIPDMYPPEVRAEVFGFHRMGLALGAFVGPLLGGLIAQFFGWRAPFFFFVPITLVFAYLGLRVIEPGRGHFERAAAGAASDVVGTDEIPPSFAESVRILWQVQTLRRIWYSLPFLAASIIGLLTLTSLYYEHVFHLGEAQRGLASALAEPAQFVGITLGIPLASRLMTRDPGIGLRMLSLLGIVIAGAWVGFALAPTLWFAVAMHVVITGVSALLVPGIFATLSLTIPPKVRALGYSMASLFILPGLIVLYIVGAIADTYGIRAGLLIMVPIFLVGAWILSSASLFVKSDISRVWTSTAAQAEVRLKRSQGLVKLLVVRNLDVHYDNVQVLFGVDFEVDEGEIVALLGTNGAGKSTLIKAISGLVEATNGAVVFDGRDMTYAPPNEVAERGVIVVPGGQGVFPTLTVAEHLRLAGWVHRKEPERVDVATQRVLELFPILRDRLPEPAGNLSGGQQQMLALGMAFIELPRLLLIDELSLGLAPAIVEQLLPLVRDMAAQGTTIVLVEQSVNLALTIAETAFFMEKGEIRFHGPTAELLERPDVLRSVFLEGAATMMHDGVPAAAAATVPASPESIARPSSNGPNGNGARAERAAMAQTVPAPGRLVLDGVSKRFGGLAALSDVSLSARAGEIVGFIGPNGAGKTTLFDVISGFLPADEGAIALGEGDDRRDITRLAASARARLGLGRSFQDGRLFGSLSVRETIALSFERHLDVRDPVAAALHLPWVIDAEDEVDARVEDLLEMLGITDFRDKLVRELSTGSRRIVDIACSLAHGPSVLLLDEPSSGIAQREAEALGPLLLRIRERTGATLLVIEHDVPLLLGVADRLVALDLGEVVAVGPPDVVVRDDRVVNSYLGTAGTAIARSGTTAEI